MKKEISILDPSDKYTHRLIPKFTSIAKGARLIFERLAKMIIGDSMTFQKKDILIEILYNWEIVLVWDFTKMRKVKKEMVPT